MSQIFLFVSIATFLVTLLLAFQRRYKLETSIRILAVGMLVVSVLLFIPVIIVNNEAGAEKISFFSVFQKALQLGSLDADYDFWINSSAEFSKLYNIFVIIISFLMPVVFGGFILSFFGDIFGSLKYSMIKPFKDAYYFSELNEKSLMLAESIYKAQKKAIILFYDFNNDTEIKELAQKNGFFVFNSSFEKFIYKSNHNIQYFMIKQEQKENLSDGLKILNAISQNKKIKKVEKIKISIFSEDRSAEVILNSTDKKGVFVSLINRTNRISNELTFNYPFYIKSNILKDKKISVLIIGTGTVGMNLIKNVIWCCQFGSDYKLVLNIIDKDMQQKRKILEHECPEFFNPKWGYNINFYEADVESSDFEKVLQQYCLYTDYGAVCFDNDELSIKTALFLRRFFLFTDKNYSNEPFIAVRVSDDEEFKSVSELTAINREKLSLKGWNIYSQKSENYNLVPFGTDRDIYSYKGIVENQLDKLALNAHAAYENMFSDKPVEKKDIIRTFSYNELDKKANMANVMHIKYKLRLLGYDLKTYDSASDEEKKNAKTLQEEFYLKLADEKVIDYLGRLEHDRWMALQSSEGMRSVSIEEAKVYAEKTGNHKHARAKLHPCICTWEELDEIIKVFDPHLKEYDTEFIKMIPDILGLRESKINVSDVKYILVKAE